MRVLRRPRHSPAMTDDTIPASTTDAPPSTGGNPFTEAPELLGISHLALTASDVPAARRFWTEVMGFELFTDTPELCFVGHRSSRTGIAITNHGGGVRERFDERRPGLDHLALAVSDGETLLAWQARLAELGVPHTPVVDSGSGLHLNLRAPDDLPVELYVMDGATAATFGLSGPRDGVSGGHLA